LTKKIREKGKILNSSKVALSIALATLLAIVTIAAVPVKAQEPSGPKTPYLRVQVYLSSDAEFGALENDQIDVVDWPLSSDWVAKFQTNPGIVMKTYAEIGDYEIDMNNQKWPTGVETPRVLDPLSSTYKHYYGTSIWDDNAMEFRQAVAHLINKGRIETEILKGFGVRQVTAVPFPALAGWTDYAGLEESGLIPDFSHVEAAAHLTGAGFIEDPTETNPNPYYDSTTMGSARYLRVDPRYGGILQPVKFYIRMDDPLRRDSGWMLVADLRKAGIQVNAIETEKTVCYKNVMVIYDYNLYTGGYSKTADVGNDLFSGWHSSQYWGGTQTGSYGGTGWSAQYNGFCHNWTQAGYVGPQTDYMDYWIWQAKYATSFDDIYEAILKTQELAQKYMPEDYLYAMTSSKAYRAGWTGAVNMEGYGADFYGTNLGSINMYNPSKNTVRWGFKSNLEGPNVVTTEWIWDAQACGLMYDGLTARNPYNLAMDYGVLAKSWETGTWAPGKQYWLFTLRPNAKFHNGDPVTPADVKFTLDFDKACGPGVNYGYSNVMDIDHVNTKAEEPALGDDQVKVYFGTASYWSLHWASFQYILNKNIWMRANQNLGWGYTYGMNDYRQFTNRMRVREYNPWEYDGDGDGLTDMTEDGTGPWIWASYTGATISVATSIAFVANNPGREVYPDTPGKMVAPGYVLTQANVNDLLTWSIHLLGDVNGDGVIDGVDRGFIVNAFGTDTSYPWGTGPNEYNPNADINTGTWNNVIMQGTYGDGEVDYRDNGRWSANYLKQI